MAIKYYEANFSNENNQDQKLDTTVSQNKTELVEIIIRAIDFAKDYKENLSLYKDPNHQNELSSINQRYLTAFYNILAAYYLKCSELQKEETRDELNMEANQYINKAMDISYQEPSTCIIRGFSSITSGQIAQAEQEFDHVIHQNSQDILSALGKAIVCFNKGKYAKSLEQYK